MQVTKQQILEWYYRGWNDCDAENPYPKHSVESVAFEIGSADFIVGDDIESVDYQTYEERINNVLYYCMLNGLDVTCIDSEIDPSKWKVEYHKIPKIKTK